MRSELFRSATLRLTAWYMLMVTVICLLFSVTVYHFGTDELAQGLYHQSQRILNEFPVFNDDPAYRQPGGELDNGARRLIKNLIIFDVIVLVVAGFGSYALARRTLRPIEAAHEQQKRFTADVSHELRTPLTAIKMESEVALMDPSLAKSALREALQSNLEEANKLNALISNLLRLTKLEASELQQEFSVVKLNNVISDAIGSVSLKAGQRKIKIKTSLKVLQVTGDHAALQQLFTILLDNAIKYSQDKTTIVLSSSKVDTTAVVTIRDEGIGIEPQALQHIFERFYRADKARTHTAAGSSYGLGLSIARQISDMHKGTITLASRAGQGTTATVVLPLAPSKSTPKG